MNVLIVDRTGNFSELKDILGKLGCKEITQISTGEEAIKKDKLYRPDVIFININLKGEMAGVETANKMVDLYNIPVIFLTAFSKSCINKSLQIPEEAVVLSKPITWEKVEYCISMALNQ